MSGSRIGHQRATHQKCILQSHRAETQVKGVAIQLGGRFSHPAAHALESPHPRVCEYSSSRAQRPRCCETVLPHTGGPLATFVAAGHRNEILTETRMSHVPRSLAGGRRGNDTVALSGVTGVPGSHTEVRSQRTTGTFALGIAIERSPSRRISLDTRCAIAAASSCRGSDVAEPDKV